MSIRTEKVESVIKRALSSHISQIAFENKLGLVSISNLKISKDLSVANVFLNVYILNKSDNINSTEKILTAVDVINQHKGMLRTHIAKEVKLKSVPELRFFYDDMLDQMQNIENLIDKVKRNAPYKDFYGDENEYKK